MEFTLKIIDHYNQAVIRENLMSVSICTDKGQITILPHHSELVTSLTQDILIIKHTNTTIERFYNHEGIAIMDNSELKIITEYFLEMRTYEKHKILNHISKLKDTLQICDPKDKELITREYKKYEKISLLN